MGSDSSPIPSNNSFSVLGAPARRALENNKINSLEDLAKFQERDILALHGMGKSSLHKLKQLLQEKGLNFRE